MDHCSACGTELVAYPWRGQCLDCYARDFAFDALNAYPPATPEAGVALLRDTDWSADPESHDEDRGRALQRAVEARAEDLVADWWEGDFATSRRSELVRAAIKGLSGSTEAEREALFEIFHYEGFGGREDSVGDAAEAESLAQNRLAWWRS